MPTITYFLERDVEFPEKDAKLLASKFKGKDHTVELGESEAKDGTVKSQTAAQAKIFRQVIEHLGLSRAAMDLLKKADWDGKLGKAGDYDFFFNVNGERHKASLDLVLPAAKEEEKPEYTFANSKLKGLIEKDDKIIKKIESVALAGTSEKGHGPVAYLDGALHTHVTNTHGIAWEWKSGKMHIVAYGKKNNKNKTQQRGGTGPQLKTCEYDWTEK